MEVDFSKLEDSDWKKQLHIAMQECQPQEWYFKWIENNFMPKKELWDWIDSVEFKDTYGEAISDLENFIKPDESKKR